VRKNGVTGRSSRVSNFSPQQVKSIGLVKTNPSQRLRSPGVWYGIAVGGNHDDGIEAATPALGKHFKDVQSRGMFDSREDSVSAMFDRMAMRASASAAERQNQS